MRFEVVNSLGKSSAATEIPWSRGEECFFDLRQEPIQIKRVPAAKDSAVFATMLAAVNSPPSIFCSSRSKVWLTENSGASAREGTGESAGHSSRIELVFAYAELNSSTHNGEEAASRIMDLWMKDEDAGSVRAKLEIRPCKFAEPAANGAALRITLHATGATPDQARMRWELSIARLQQSLLFISRAMRQRLSLED
ncbi:MAG TPA: hypothetical protein VFO34_14895 [Candidatus Acidoferrales bacterium]|nr:hypothetical protein [Candidatus Acidoferrales bacterium]